MTRPPFAPRVELLEGREVPATLVNASTVTFRDVDGDDVTVKLTRPLLTDTATADLVLDFNVGSVDGSNAAGQQLQAANLFALGAAAQGVGLTVTAARNATTGGDGLVNVGQVDAADPTASLDLAAVVIDGDLGRLQAGDATTATTGLASLTVQSLGRFGTATGSPDLQTAVSGRLGTLRVKSDVVGAFVSVTGGDDGKIGSVLVGGSLIAVGTGTNSGSIQSTGDMGAVRVGGDLVGGGGPDSGAVKCDGAIKGGRVGGTFVGVAVGGSLFGGGGSQSGRVRANDDMAAVRIGGDVRGAGGNNSGQVRSVSGRIAGITVGGSLIGGSVLQSGTLISSKGTGPATIRGNVLGGGGSRSGGLFVDGQGDLPAVTVGGSVVGGTGTTLSGFITANGVLGTVKVAGSLVGTAANPVTIAGRGLAALAATATADVAIKSLSVGGRAEFARILAGYSFDLAPVDVDAQVGSITVGGDWVASSVAAGAVDGGNGFGNVLDARITDATDDPDIVSRIGVVVIKGQAVGTAAAGDHFGFVAEQVASLKVGGTTIPLTPGSNNDDAPVGATGDLRVREL
jgi:hypothetical protein